jgi:hypothetical protein
MGAFPWSLEHILLAFELKGWDEYIRRSPWLLNIVGIRTADEQADTFNDWICTFRKTTTPEWEFRAYPATTDPGTYYRKNPININGTLILIPSFYKGLWVLGKHKGEYDALVQVGIASVWRDNNKDNILTAGPSHNAEHVGLNLHRARKDGTSTIVDKWSAGCQVIASSKDYDSIIQAARDQITHTPIRLFDYALLTEADVGNLNV